ncbi:hypothetical protein LTR17_013749 [Elasticomyces elasticus]|nr:hypothetical protein LTR17_013749 [Elasticomyces elasticus]
MSGRQSPFKRQPSASPAPTLRPTTPTPLPPFPTKTTATTTSSSLSPTKTSPFVRRPSQITHHTSSERPASPFARPTSSLGLSLSPSRNVSTTSQQTPESPTRNGEVPFGTPFARPVSGLGIPSSSPSRQASYGREKSGTPEVPRVEAVRRLTPPVAPLPIEANDEEEPELTSPSPFDGAGPSLDSPVLTTAQPFSHAQASLRPAAVRIPTSSTVSTIRAPLFQPTPTPPAPVTRSPYQQHHQPQKPTPTSHTRPTFSRGLSANNASGGYTNVPSPLLRSMRESFEVLDASNSGTISAASVAEMLEQMGLPNDPSSLRTFFPPGGPDKLNLARYLDTLAGPMAELSHPDELIAAFEAFDIDDSGQIDSNELRAALLQGGGDERGGLSEREIDSILGEFGGRRHFGGKGLGHGANGGMGKGEVFRYREFMAGVGGTGGGGEGIEGGVVA